MSAGAAPPPSLRDGPPPRAGEVSDLADPERALAVAYAPTALRSALKHLFALDERLGQVVGTTHEPGIGLIRLAWWREALERLDTAPPPAEPLLAALAAELLPRGLAGADLARLEEGWAALLDEPLDAGAVARFGRARGATLFTLAARLLGADDPRLADGGAAWALADLAHRHSSAEVRAHARGQARHLLAARPPGGWRRPARPLAALVTLARRDVASDAQREQGAPGRLLRMLAMKLTGR